jgi:3-deoxy-D-manno-octulosonic-acid transferase
VSFSPALAAYRVATVALGPFAGAWLRSRARNGKEDASRLPERFGCYSRERPAGTLVWMHSASVGESGVALALVDALAARDGSLSFLLSSGTRTSAELIARRAPPGATHVYVPLDRADAVRRFLDHWRPDLGVFVESELWPNLILAAQARGIPLALVNARMSPKSLRRWLRWRAAGARLLQAFAFISAADGRTASALSLVRGEEIAPLGNLKLAAPAPRFDPGARAALAAEIGGRPVWLAASTHPGEDEIALAAHERLRAAVPDALLIIAPRHPERGAAIAALANGAPRRSLAEACGSSPVYVADTLGELGLFYDLAPVALIGGSLLPQLKGHNPIEPAKLDCAIVTGPHVESFSDVFEALFNAGGAVRVDGAGSLADAVAALWQEDTARMRQTQAARDATAIGADAFGATVNQLTAMLPQSRAHARPANASA